MLRGILGFIYAICAHAPAASCVSPEELRRQDEATCTVYGFHPGTDTFAACLGARAWRGATQLRQRHRRIEDIGDTGGDGGGLIGRSGR